MTAWRQAVAQRPRHVAVWAVAGGLLAATWPPGATPALALAAVLLLRASRLPRRLALVAAAAVLAGGALGQARLEALDRHGLGPLLEQRVAGHATLLTQPRADAAGRARALVGLRVGPAQGRVLLRLPGTAAERRIGRELAVAGRLRPPDRGARALRAHATLLAERAVPTGARRGGLAGLVDGVRDRAAAALARGLPPVDGALLQGMVLGQDAGLPQHVVDDLRAAGLAHLTAASGQNVLLLAALGLAAGALLGLPVRPRLVLVLGLVALYVPLAGAGPSIQRAGVMGAAGLAATLAGRPAARWYAVGLAAAVTLALDPRAAGDPGWQMSFAAVVALAALARPLAARLQADAGAPGPGRRVRVPRGVAEALAVAVVATLATAPVAAAHFGRTSLAAVPANVLAAPAVAPVMWLGTTAGALAQAAPALAAPVAAVAAVPVAYVRALGGAAGGLGAAEVAVPPALVVVTCATALGALGLLAAAHRCRQRAADAARDAARGGVVPDDPVPPRVPSAAARRARRAAGVAVAVALAAAWAVALRPPPRLAPPAPGVLRVTFLDVGQGDATLLQAGGGAVLVDAGPPGAGVPGLLARAGVRRLDALVLSHDAADHLGGAAEVLARVPTTLVLDGRDGGRSPAAAAVDAPARAAGARLLAARAGQQLRAGALRLRVLWPPSGRPVAGADPNDRAVVLEAGAAGTHALLPADAESAVLAGLGLGPVDVLKVSHHGSRDDGLPALLARLAPRVAVVSAGRRNPYGHPAAETLAGLRAVPRVLRTDRAGTVVVEGRGGRLHVGSAS